MRRVLKTKKKECGAGGGDQDRGSRVTMEPVLVVDGNERVRRVFQLGELPEAMRRDIRAKIAAEPPPPPRKPKKKVKVKEEPVEFDEVDSGGVPLEVRRGAEQQLDTAQVEGGALNGNGSGGRRVPVEEAVGENDEAAGAGATRDPTPSPEISRASLALEDDENIGISATGVNNFNRDYAPPVNEVREGTYDSNIALSSSDDEDDEEEDEEDEEDEVDYDGNFSECTTMSITGEDDDADTIIMSSSEGAGDTQSSILDEEEEIGDSTDGPGAGAGPELETQQRAFAQISIQDDAGIQLRQPVYGSFARSHGHEFVRAKPSDEDEEVDIETVDPTGPTPILIITLNSDGDEEDEEVDVEGVDEVSLEE